MASALLRISASLLPRLHATGLAATTCVYLRLHHGLLAAELPIRFYGLVGRAAKEMPVYWHAVLFKEAFGLIFMYLHS